MTTTKATKYEIEIPTFGWVREQLAGIESVRNVNNPTILVEKDLEDGLQIRVGLEDMGKKQGIEIYSAELWRWVEDAEWHGGGYHVPVRQVDPHQIELVEMGQAK